MKTLSPTVVVPGHGEPVDARFVRSQRAELAEVAALHAAVAAGELDAAAATRRSPYPSVPWPSPPRAPLAAHIAHYPNPTCDVGPEWAANPVHPLALAVTPGQLRRNTRSLPSWP